MNNGITVQNLLRTLPGALAGDQAMRDIANTVAQSIEALSAKADRARLYTAIDSMEEVLLDILAVDFKVDWWNADYSLEEKRKTLKNSWYVHRHLGTPSAVERAISAIYEGSTVQEWPDYNGCPFHFRLLIPVDQTSLDPSKHETVLGLVEFYKNLRSVLDEVEYYGSSGTAMYYVAAASAGASCVAYGIADRY